MQSLQKYTSGFILIALGYLGSASGQDLDKGWKVYEGGDWRGALKIWETAINAGSDNPALNFSYIEVVAGESADSLYEQAERYYFEALNEQTMVNHREVFQEELYRLRPVVDDAVYKRWVRYLRKEDPALLKEIREHWNRENTFLSSGYNERLNEHWKRVVFAKRVYNKNSKSGFGTDDRGKLYVKMGKPDRITEGSVSLSEYYDPVSGISVPIRNNIYFEYELWYYGERSYVFGIPGTGGPFGLQRGILDLIPEAGNRPGLYFDPNSNLNQLADQQANLLNQASGNNPVSNQAGSVALPGMKEITREGASLLIQYSVLEQTATVDPFYFTMYNQMSQDLIRSNLNGSSNTFNTTASTQNMKYKALEQNWAIDRELGTPRSVTETKPALKSHKVNSYLYNFLDEQFQPICLVITEVGGYENVEVYLAAQTDTDFRRIFQVDHFIFFDENWNKVRDEVFSDALASPGYSNYHSYIMNAPGEEMLFQSSIIDSTGTDAVVSGHIISSGNTETLRVGDELTRALNESGFAVSDIMLAPFQEESGQTRIPFFPSLDNQFEADSEMVIYFETYGIPRGTTFGVKYGDEEEGNTVEVAFTSDGRLNKVWFMVNLDDDNYDSGEHEMILELNYRGDIVKRSIKFQVK